MTASYGRRVTFKVGTAGAMYGMAPLVDDLPMQHELIALSAVTVLVIPHAAVRLELSETPTRWESIAREATARGRIFVGELRQFVFDNPRQRRRFACPLHASATATRLRRHRGPMFTNLPGRLVRPCHR